MNDPNELLQTMRRATQQFRSGRDFTGPYEAAVDLADAAAQLDYQLQAGGALPRDWQPPVAMRESDGRFLDVARAERRLRDVLDRSIRDDARTDATLMPAVLGPHAEPKFREHLVKLLARAIIDELEAEQQQLRAMARQAAAGSIRQDLLDNLPSYAVRIQLDEVPPESRLGKGQLPDSLRRPSS